MNILEDREVSTVSSEPQAGLQHIHVECLLRYDRISALKQMSIIGYITIAFDTIVRASGGMKHGKWAIRWPGRAGSRRRMFGPCKLQFQP
jgi:hypothetical protein